MNFNFDRVKNLVSKISVWSKNPNNKIKLYLLIAALVVIVCLKIWLLSSFFFSNVQNNESQIFYVYDNYTLDSVTTHLKKENIISNENSFRLVSGFLGYKDKTIKSGRFKIKPRASNFNLVRMFKSGLQTPAKITLNNIRTLDELAAKLGSYLKADSTTFMTLFQNQDLLTKFGLKRETVMTIFIPDTYEMYWDLDPQNVIERFYAINKKFWNKERLAKADSLMLTPQEVYTLASIVEKETNKVDERPAIAGVYLNRYHSGMPLQADPTVVFANNDFTIKRVTGKHTSLDSPYNTYMYPGLPPGPICMPEKSSIDAVLNATAHDFMFFCARPDLSGYHSFAVTFNAHVQNAKAYREFLDKNGY